jgi:hypothetical protein
VIKKLGVAILFLFIYVDQAHAVEDFTVLVPKLRVYSEPNLNSAILSVLNKGQTVKAGSNPGSGFKKVLIKAKNGKNTIGYIALADLTGPKRVRGRSPRDKGSISGLHEHWGFGLNLGFNYQTQGGKALTDAGGDMATTGKLSGANVRVGALLDIPFGSTFNGELFIDYKPTTLTGTAAAGGTVTQTSDIILQQSVIALGTILKFYSGDTGNLWYGPGVELDHVGSSTLQVGSNAASSYMGSDSFQAFAATGYDFIGGKNFFIVPNFRLGAAFSAPVTLEFDMIVSGIYRF